MTRVVRKRLQALLFVLLGVAVLVPLHADEKPTKKADPVEALRQTQRSNNRVDTAIRNALQFFKNQQNVDGSIGKRRDTISARRPTADTALALLAFVATGTVPGEPRYGTVVEKGLDFLLSEGRQNAQGYFGGRDKRGMYTHGITTLLLVELLGMGVTAKQDEKLLRACKKAIDVILRSQAVAKGKRDRGGWRYTPRAEDSDLSVTVWQVTALRAARNIGLDVPQRSIDEAVSYVRRCFHTEHGGFSYQPPVNGIKAPTASTTAAGLFSLQVCGIYEGPDVQSAADWLMHDSPRLTLRANWFYYGVYYYAQAMHQLGERHTKHARKVLQGLLLNADNPMQLPDGSFKSAPASSAEKTAGPIYRTTMAVLALSAEYELLPIFQR